MKIILPIITIFMLLMNCNQDKDCKYTKAFGCKKELGFFEQPRNQIATVVAVSSRSSSPVVVTPTPTPSPTPAPTTTPTFSVGGTITGLVGTGLVLQNTTTNNTVEELTISFGATTFAFVNSVSAFNVAIKTSPSNLTCTVTNGTGTASAAVTNVTIACVAKSLAITGNVTTFAGTAGSAGTADGTGAVARFNSPFVVVPDGVGNLFVGEGGGNCLRRINISTAAVSTFAGTCGSAGTTDGTGTAARFANIQGIISDGTNLFIADTNNSSIRRIVISTGVVTTIAGTSGSTGTTDGTGAAARFNGPNGIATDGPNLYISDYNNHSIRRLVISTGVVTTFAGQSGTPGTTDGTGTAARFNQPSGIVTDGTNFYVTEFGNHILRRVVISSGVVTTLAGTAGVSGTTDGTGAAARFNSPQGVFLDGANLYISDRFNHSIRRFVISTGAVTTFAGLSGTSGTTDGSLGVARFNNPMSSCTDGTSIFIPDSTNHTIRRIQ